MFNTFLTNILNSYLGEIVEDLDLDNIGSGALHGDILLIDLKLRPDCLSVLELPLEVKYGSIGKLSLKIPWTNLASSPVTVNIQVRSILTTPIFYLKQPTVLSPLNSNYLENFQFNSISSLRKKYSLY